MPREEYTGLFVKLMPSAMRRIPSRIGSASISITSALPESYDSAGCAPTIGSIPVNLTTEACTIYRRPILPLHQPFVALLLGGCEVCETPTVPVMPDPRLRLAGNVDVLDDFGNVPRIVDRAAESATRPIKASTDVYARLSPRPMLRRIVPTTDGF